MKANLEAEAISESAALRALDWPASRRAELRLLLPSVPTGSCLIYQKSAVAELRNASAQTAIRILAAR